MSFATELADATRAALDGQKAASEQFIEAWVRQFSVVCRQRAGGGHTNHQSELKHAEVPEDGPGSMSYSAVRDAVVGRLRMLGLDASFHQNSMTVCGSWRVAAPHVAPPPKPCQGGQAGTCPICMETRPVVALMPCGHAVCGACQQSLTQCPLCRENVFGATRGIFIQ